MQLDDFDYHLPAELIAQQPLAQRSAGRLLCLQREQQRISDQQFVDLPDWLKAGDLLVMNNTRVLPARLYARKPSGGRLEILLERLLSEHEMLVQIRANRPLRAGAEIIVQAEQHPDVSLELLGRQGDFYHLRSPEQPVQAVLQAYGTMPLPPYIERPAAARDERRYQTVFAAVPGAVAAPTAGLHFDQELLRVLDQKGIGSVQITLHVGAGTFQPVRVENVLEHQMHAEYLEVSAAACARINAARANGGRIIAVGTTSVRALETAAASGRLKPYTGDSRLFIYPGYQFQAVDAMLTNFHLPKSTLLMLVSAFAGQAFVARAYAHAVEQRYRFFSYGDAMLMV